VTPMANERILITGARRGIGAALAAGLADPGRTLLIHHVGAAAEAERVAAGCRDRGAAAEVLAADLADPAAVADLASRAGDVDVLINNAAHASNVGIGVLPPAEWQVTFAVNVTAPMLLAQALAPGMAARRWGRIVNVTSATVRLGGPSGPSYVSSKAALIGLTRSLARSYGRDGITVNAISPGKVDTEGELELPPPPVSATAVQAIPGVLVPDDLAGTLRYLVSDDAAKTTGQVIEVGAGMVLR
jgi:NAD(P)-dependent dehydrogenase (short-subunit alcohol dehydrogenase family)